MKENANEVKIILALGGLDPTSGAGVSMDIKAAGAAGCHTFVAVTTFTVQNGERFISANPMNPTDVEETLDILLESAAIGAVKTGALCNGAIARLLADRAEKPHFPPLIIDPVMKSTTSGTLLDKDGMDVLLERLLPLTTMITPNLAEAGMLAGLSVQTVDDMELAARRIVELGARAVLVKGGHLDSDELTDIYLDNSGNHQVFDSVRQGSFEVRGTGCALASMIAAFIAQGFGLLESVTRARVLLIQAIRLSVQTAPGPKILNFNKEVNK